MIFKIKIKKVELPPSRKLGKGIFQQLEEGNRFTYNKKDFTLESLEKAFEEFFNKNKKENNEYRERFSFKSQIFKQTYKFGQ